MHKDEASRLFASLGDPNRVKIVKMLYHNETLSVEALTQIMDLSSLELKSHLSLLCEVGLVKKQNEEYCCNKELLDTLLAFIPTRCGCCS
ncbi:MAG: helix-turn-helix domain-containing protein [Anaeroplasmataceae bacterium]|nr:helix-turn-helix domain-containing protein [Anaeroplasmataceae bacterium]MDE6414580.1 helix-turn-helix domain-containing protein [Anaeroplasmataceae bacterium]